MCLPNQYWSQSRMKPWVEPPVNGRIYQPAYHEFLTASGTATPRLAGAIGREPFSGVSGRNLGKNHRLTASFRPFCLGTPIPGIPDRWPLAGFSGGHALSFPAYRTSKKKSASICSPPEKKKKEKRKKHTCFQSRLRNLLPC